MRVQIEKNNIKNISINCDNNYIYNYNYNRKNSTTQSGLISLKKNTTITNEKGRRIRKLYDFIIFLYIVVLFVV